MPYYAKVIDEQFNSSGTRRVIVEKPIDKNQYVVKAVIKCNTEEKARELLDYLLHFRIKGPAANKPEAPAPKRGRKKKTEGK